MTMNTRSMLNRFVTGMIVVAAVLVWCGTAQAQTNFYWTNTASSLSTWNTPANWTNGYPSQNGGTNVILNFRVAGTYTSSNDFVGIFTNNSLVFGAGTVTLAGGTNAFMNNGAVMPVVTNYSGAIATINNPLTFATNTTFAGANDITVNGDMSGSGALTKTGSGTLTLTGSNTYSGVTTVVSPSKLKVGSSKAFTGTGSLATLNSTVVFDLNGYNATFVGSCAVNNSAILTNSGTLATIEFDSCGGFGANNSGLVVGNLAVKIVGNGSVIDVSFANTNCTFSGGLTLLGNARYQATLVGKNCPGTGLITVGLGPTDKAGIYLTNVGSNSIANDIVVNSNLGNDRGSNFRFDGVGNILSGTLTANVDSKYLTYQAPGGATVTGKITGPAGIVIGHDGNGGAMTLTLNSSPGLIDYNGNTTIQNNNATLVLGANDQIPNGIGKGNVSLAGILDLNGHSDTINGLSGVGVVSNGAVGAAALTVGDNDQTSTFSGTIKSTAGTLALTKIGAGTLTLSGNNTYNGTTWVNAGKFIGVTGGSCSNSALYLADGATNSVSAVAGGTWSCASLTCTGGTTTLDFDFGSLQDTMAPLNVIGGLYVTGTVNVLVRNGDWPATGTYPLVKYGVNGVDGSVIFNVTTPPGVTVSSVINNTSSKQLELVVTAVPSYTSQPTSVWTNKANGVWGDTTCWTNSVANGTNVVADFSKANINADLYVNVDAAHTIGTLVYNNINNTKNLYVTNSPVTLATTSGIPAIIVSNQAVTIGSSLQGTQGFIKNGAGTLTLTAATGNYTGDTITKAGTLTIGNATANYYYTNGLFYLGDPLSAVNSVLKVGNGSTVYFKQIVVNRGSGTRTIFSGGTANFYVSGGITLGSDGIAQNLSLGTDIGSATWRLYASISDPVGLSGTGGTVTIGSASSTYWYQYANTYSGDTRIQNGTLYNNDAGALQNSTLNLSDSGVFNPQINNSILGGLKGSSNLNMNAKTLLIGNNNRQTAYFGVLSNGGLAKIGTNTLTLGGANTYAGGTTISNGFIGVSNNLAMSTGLVTLSGGGIAGPAGAWAITNVVNMSSSAMFDTTGSLALMGPVTNSGALRKIGAGTLTLSATNTYTGGTTVSNGTLIVNGAVTGAVTVVAGSTLGGTGVVAGVVTNNGTITAADITINGTLTVTNLVMGEYSTYVWNSDAAATTNDVIQVNGTLTLPQYATVTVTRAGARIPSPGVLFAGFTNNLSAADLSKWVINGAPASTRARVTGNQVVLVVPNGWLISIQ